MEVWGSVRGGVLAGKRGLGGLGVGLGYEEVAGGCVRYMCLRVSEAPVVTGKRRPQKTVYRCG